MSSPVVLRWAGDIDLDQCEQLLSDIDAAVRGGGVRTLVVDLSAVGYVDSIGLGVFIHARNRALAARISLVLRSASQRLKRLMSTAGMAELFTFEDLHPVEDAAVDELPVEVSGASIADPRLDRIAALARFTLGVPIALVTQVDRDKQIIPGGSGLPLELEQRRAAPLRQSMCAHVVARSAPLIVPDAAADPLFAEHPAHLEGGVVAYAGMPIMDSDGTAIGSMCAVDTAPHVWTDDELERLRFLAEACSAEFQRKAAVKRADAALEQLRSTRALQERVFGHLVSVSLNLADTVSLLEGDPREQVATALQQADTAMELLRPTLREASASLT